MDRLIVSVSQSAVIEGESAILGCDRCSPRARIPFWQILDQLRTQQEGESIYLLPVLACCPNCRAEIDEITLVEPKLVSNRAGIAPLCEARDLGSPPLTQFS
jgi:hypothetical protein